MLEYDDLQSIRAGQIIAVEELPGIHYKVTVDFGPEIGHRISVVGAKREYPVAALQGKLVLGVVTFPPRTIKGIASEVLLLGVHAPDGSLSLLTPDRGARLGDPLY